MKRLAAVALASLAVVIALSSWSGGPGIGATSVEGSLGPYYKTYTGLDFDSIDSDDVVRFASGTGGGVWVRSRALAGDSYLETGVDLPAGAQVTAVTFYVRSCETLAFNRPQLYFGAYGPTGGTFTYFIPEDFTASFPCGETNAVAFNVDPAVIVDNSQFRYVLGYRTILPYATDTYDPEQVKSALIGARVTYQMPGAYLPSVQR